MNKRHSYNVLRWPQLQRKKSNAGRTANSEPLILEGSHFLPTHALGTSPPIVLPDRTIHGTQRDRFEVHNLTDIAGGSWKAVHIPDKDISAMLQIANAKNGKSMSLDIQHEVTTSPDDENSGVSRLLS